ncbi:TolC family protein [Dysgonomonas sp. 216]|uniref:TolC family protein n=1 Tax=Dysgonomonas sp. 216 TaxID=2302934 RepID=UPI0013D39E32|nr:TolC family protein [Dysgonomonas sp. 216]NDW19040.1 TolC family protein [Dysgonomonas sp. 216]
MKKYILLIGFIGATCFAQAQQKWTLRQCIDYAIENNIEIKQEELKVKDSEIDLSTSKNSRLPNLNANASQDFNFGRGIGMGNNTYTKGNIGSTNLSISSNIPLFTGFKIPNEIKQDKLNLQAATEGLNKVKDNMQLQVASLYLEVLFKKEILKAFEDQIELTKKQVSNTEILVSSGKVAESQLYDIRAQFAKDELNITNAKNDLDIALLNLAQALNLQETNTFDIEEPNLANFIDDNISSVQPPTHVYQRAITIKPHVKEIEYKLESSKKGLKIAEAGYWPKLDLSLRYGTGFDHVYKSGYDNPSISSQLGDNQTKYIGFSLSIPIFNRFQVRNQVRSARLNIENYELQLENTKLALYKEIQQAYQSAVAAQAKYSSTEKAYDAAAESFKYAEERYKVGKSTVYEFSEAQTKMLTSKSEQIQAKYDFLFRTKILDFYNGKEIDIK